MLIIHFALIFECSSSITRVIITGDNVVKQVLQLLDQWSSNFFRQVPNWWDMKCATSHQWNQEQKVKRRYFLYHMYSSKLVRYRFLLCHWQYALAWQYVPRGASCPTEFPPCPTLGTWGYSLRITGSKVRGAEMARGVRWIILCLPTVWNLLCYTCICYSSSC